MMPSRRLHMKFDDYLKDKGVIYLDSYPESVHKRMDRGVEWFGPEHREWDYYHGEEGIRDWLSGFEHLAYRETLTDYLRAALGHVVLDDIERRGNYYDEDDLIVRAYRSFVGRGFHRKYYRTRR